jgi:hypothetical protein
VRNAKLCQERTTQFYFILKVAIGEQFRSEIKYIIDTRIYDTSGIRALLKTRAKFAQRGEAKLCNRTSFVMMRYHTCIL